jgi:hypothetical protein
MTIDERVQAKVLAVCYFPDERAGQLWMADGDCCDMEGAVALFEQIDPRVRTIQTFSGGRWDTRYSKRRGKWIAFREAGSECAGAASDVEPRKV